ncbi:phage holin family protein [Patulibacter minatonensis]|uniref:phage holin family protein n=1 Tax=Patulibacter minatonensis TaxID=298163 RepID=UPI00047A8490|nr:phage holin family protein [Patulibacter minatonensis]
MRGADQRRRDDAAREASLKSVVEHLANVTERSQHIVRDEIELAKAEVAQKVGSIGRGVAVGGAAGVFIALGGLFFLHGLSFFFWYAFGFPGDQIFWGYFITALLLFVLAGVGGFLAWKFVKKGAPPVPTMAIDEAKLIRESVQGAAARQPPEPQHGPSRTLGTPGARRAESSAPPKPAAPEASTSAVQKPVATVLPTSVDEPKADAPKTGAPKPEAPKADGSSDAGDTPKGGSDES